MVIGSLEMLSGRGKKEYAKEAQAVASTGPDGPSASDAPAAITGNGSADAPEQALVAM